MPKSIQPYGWLLILLSVTIICYIPGLSGPFLLDDLNNIYPARLQAFTLDELLRISLGNDSGPLGRPISAASFALTEAFFGFTPFAYKLVNLGLHLTIALLLYNFVILCTRAIGCLSADQRRVSLLVTAMWCLHPIQVSTVLYSVQRMAQLSALFCLTGSWLYLKLRLDGSAFSKNRKLLYILGICFSFILGIFSKETAVLLPLYLFAIEAIILGYQRDAAHGLWIRTHITIFIAGSLGALAYIWYDLPAMMLRYETYNYTMLARVLTELTVVWHYIIQLIIPKLHSFTLFHDDYVLREHVDLITILSSLMLILTVAWVVVYRSRYPLAAFGIALYWVSHLLESTIFPLELVFEHRVYFGSIGIFFILADGIHRLWSITNLTKVMTIVVCVWLALLVLILNLRVQTWANEEVFLSVTVQDHPKSARAHGELANYYIRHDRLSEAMIELQAAEALRPHDAGIVIHQLILTCSRVEKASMLSNNALTKVRDSVVTPYLISSMDSLLRNSLAGLCPNIDPYLLLSITTRMLKNPSIKTYKHWYPMVLTLQARAYLINDQFTNAMKTYQMAFEADHKNTPALIEKATVAIAYQRWDIAEKALVQLDKTVATQWVKHHKERAELWEAIHAYKQTKS